MGEYINSKQARFDKSHVSCGVVEVHHLPDGNATGTLFAIANHLYNKANGRPAAFVLFSDVVGWKDSRGEQLEQEIKKFGFTGLVASMKEINPKTGNTIRVWLWHVNHEAFRKWYTEEYVNRVQTEV